MSQKENVYLFNRMRQKLLQGEVVTGTGGNDPRSIDRAGLAGYDFVRFEGEHGNIYWMKQGVRIFWADPKMVKEIAAELGVPYTPRV